VIERRPGETRARHTCHVARVGDTENREIVGCRDSPTPSRPQARLQGPGGRDKILSRGKARRTTAGGPRYFTSPFRIVFPSAYELQESHTTDGLAPKAYAECPLSPCASRL